MAMVNDAPTITREAALARLIELQGDARNSAGDLMDAKSRQHEADAILRAMLKAAGYEDVIAAWERIAR